jgi:hypothetical protein
MIRNAFLIVLAVMLLVGCSKGITKEKFVDTMAALGCHATTEGTPEADKIYKEKGVTAKDIENFRKNSNAKEMVEVSTTIATKVAECYGVKK